MTELDAIVLETGNNPGAAVIWLHGLGASGHDFVPIVQQLQLPAELSIRFIFPHAPVRPITINQGYEMPGWYDITSLSVAGRDDAEGINESSASISQICEQQEAAGIVSNRIILAGFSQGGAIALNCGLQYPRRLAGIMALSTYLPACTQLGSESTSANANLPVFMAHGTHDDVVAPSFGKGSYQQLKQAGYNIDWYEYPMAHSVCVEEIEDIQHWLINCLAGPQG